jgi:hypothetical protein
MKSQMMSLLSMAALLMAVALATADTPRDTPAKIEGR